MACSVSVTLVHPAKAVGWNEMLSGRARSPHRNGRFRGRNPESKFALQIAAKLLQMSSKTKTY